MAILLIIASGAFICMTLLFRDVESRESLIPYEFMGEHIPICSTASCKGRCGTTKSRYCSCDQHCMTFHDCCYDYGKHCTRDAQPAPEMPEHNTDQGFSNLQTWTSELQPIAGQLTCVKYQNPKYLDRYLNILTVASCPSQISETNNCLTMSNDFRVNTPLLYKENMLIYRNLACLECNVINVEMEMVLYAEPNYRCENVTVFEHAIELIKNEGGSTAYDFLIEENCSLRYEFVPSIYPALGESLAMHLLTCGLIQTCNQSNFNGTSVAFLNAQHYCKLYLSPIRSYEKEKYKNAHCAYCNGLSMNDIEVCSPDTSSFPMFDPLPSMTLLLNVRDDDVSIPQISVGGIQVCKTGFFLDVMSKRCFEACSDGLVSVGGVCVESDVAITAPNLTLPAFSMNQDLLFLLKTSSSVNDLYIMTLKFMKDLTDNVLMKEIVDNCELKYYWLDMPPSNITCVQVKSTKKWHGPFPAINNNAYTAIPNKYMTGVMGTTTFPLEVDVFALQIDLFSNETMSCPARHMQAHIDYDILFSNGDQMDSMDGRYISKYGKMFENKRAGRELPVGYQIKFNFKSQSFEPHRHFAIFCQAKIANCLTETITIATAEIINGSLHDNTTGRTYEEGTFVHVSYQQYIVCANRSENTPLKSDNNKIGYSVEATVKGILTLLCTIISPAFLFVALITYCLLKPLRSLPGIAIMNLSISLLFAQIIFQVGHALRPWPLLCYIMAIVQHYFWLVTFMWTNILAYLSYKTFTKSTIREQVKVTRIIKLLIYAWGIPLVFLTVCIVIEMYQWLPFHYGNENSCWINGNEGRLYLFAVPLAVIIVINLVLFICTSLAIRRTMQVAETASNTHQENRNRFIIYIKLSTVMGFTWLFGFLANLKIISFFWYPFIILNGLQGVFICLSFVMNRRVFRMYKELLSTKKKHECFKRVNENPVENTISCKATQSTTPI